MKTQESIERAKQDHETVSDMISHAFWESDLIRSQINETVDICTLADLVEELSEVEMEILALEVLLTRIELKIVNG